jgi:endonuclease YncB( thermonuclease family)
MLFGAACQVQKQEFALKLKKTSRGQTTRMNLYMIRRLAALALAVMVAPASAETVRGPATVIDGDTVEIAEKRVRLFAVDAPESTQTCDRNGERWACGKAAGDELRSMIGNYPVSCSGDEIDTYGRLVATCTIDGIDLNREMVARGWATAFRRYSDRYVADETRARASKLGLWTSSFMSPEDYRASQRGDTVLARPQQRQTRVQTFAAPAVSSCSIKGNRNRKGQWIYHLPGMPYYEQTRAEEIFCTEAQAQAAGYRRAIVK